jgi:hypothetical protein
VCLLLSSLFVLFGVAWTSQSSQNAILNQTFWEYYFCVKSENGVISHVATAGESIKETGYLTAVFSVFISFIAGIIPILSVINSNFNCCLCCFIKTMNDLSDVEVQDYRITYTQQKKKEKLERSSDLQFAQNPMRNSEL